MSLRLVWFLWRTKEHDALNGRLHGEGRKNEEHHPYPVLWIWDFLLPYFRPCSPLFASVVSWLKGRSFMVVRQIPSIPTLFLQLSVGCALAFTMTIFWKEEEAPCTAPWCIIFSARADSCFWCVCICLSVGELDPLCCSLSLMNQRLGRTDTVPWKL